jgi:hypothetical protein
MKTTPLLAYHGNRRIKEKYLKRVRAHAKADEIISGSYWENGKGCAVGCTIHGSSHAAYETEIGVPQVLARLEDRLFEGLYATGNVQRAKEWPEEFLRSIKPGADLSLVWAKFGAWLLLDETSGVIAFAKRPQTIESIQRVGALYQRWAAGAKPAITEWESAKNLAVAHAAHVAHAAYAAAYVAAAAADAATYAAATYADAAAAAYADARSKHYQTMADKLIELLKAA